MDSKRQTTLTIVTNIELEDKRASITHRICDDLLEVILQSLPIEDKFNFRGVSKQFNSCLIRIAERQRSLQVWLDVGLGDKTTYQTSPTEFALRLTESRQFWVKQLTIALKTFKNIDDISIRIFGAAITYPKELLEAIVDNCKLMKTFRFEFSGVDLITINKFGHKFGKSLQILKYSDCHSNAISSSLLRDCPNLTSLQSRIIDPHLWLNNGVSTKKLKKLKNLQIGPLCQKTTFDKFVDKCPDLTHLAIELNPRNAFIHHIIYKLSELKQLENLSICLYFSPYFSPNLFPESLISSLEAIAMNCNQLKTFSIRFYCGNNLKIKEFYRHFQQFSTLTKLSFWFYSNLSSNMDLNFLKNCRKLIELELSTYRIVDTTFTQIDEILPYLQCLTIGTSREITDQGLNSISKLKALKQLKIYQNYTRFYKNRLGANTESGLLSLIKRCQLLQTIKIEYPLNITGKTFIAIIEKSFQKLDLYFEYELFPKIKLNLDHLIINNGYPMDNLMINGMTKEDLIRQKSGNNNTLIVPICKFH